MSPTGVNPALQECVATVAIANSGVVSVAYVITPFARLREEHSMAELKKVGYHTVKQVQQAAIVY